MRMNSLLKRSFAGNSARFSFLSVSFYGTREKKKKKIFCTFKTERSRFLIENIMCLRTMSAACIFTSDNCHFSNF